ncbi:type III-A CRISPR-associated RAMP protein Csm3 [Aneurinibacillus sp. UBA3580]|jgi:CRISPR-associated protein Csm3|uniref:type III-A CRISPR-associated RAMP protein Csm3 n=1 Tax=Aneurinibacillus sp. UBA3580 TaxID=1946041 RepID=UPI00257BC970|nr:type III-A CRISPR-associated RAMP protein Csm3 [Aneurinibacillus sp. UBA3580]
MLLKHIIEITATLRCETGLRIGGSNDTIEIGGLDNPILRHPITGEPYIPGSSLKGKMRSLLEGVNGRFYSAWNNRERKLVRNTSNNGKPCECGMVGCKVCTTFGYPANPKRTITPGTTIIGPARLIVRDSVLTDASHKWLQEAQREKGLNFSEVKHENTIHRQNNSANPRPNERVPAGAEFKVEMMLKIYDQDNKTDLINFVKQGLKLLEHDYLGGSGSRGYGKVTFHNVKVTEHSVNQLIKEETNSEN